MADFEPTSSLTATPSMPSLNGAIAASTTSPLAGDRKHRATTA